MKTEENKPAITWSPIPLSGLYAEAQNPTERSALIRMAKTYHIRESNFAEAARYRDLEKVLDDAIQSAIKSLGSAILETP